MTLLKMEHIQKIFPGVHALDDVQFSLNPGEVHALMGENGAGKSTLMKILTGIYPKNGGSIELDGKPVEIHTPAQAQELGIYIIHQELNLMGDLTVAENIYIGREGGFLINQKKLNQRAAQLLKRLNIDIDPLEKVKNLTVAKQQMVEVAKALSYDNIRILIMDEPTAALTESEINDLFSFIRKLKSDGVGIIYISHRMEELDIIADRVTVMRDGQYVQTLNMAQTNRDEIICLMVGRNITEKVKSASACPSDAPVALELQGLTSLDVKDISFSVRKGEILGVSGLMGAGRTEMARLICGADKKMAGKILMDGQEILVRDPSDAVKAGIGYLSENRKEFGLCLGLSVAQNIAMATLDAHSGKVVVNDQKIRDTAVKYQEQLRIKTPDVDTPTLSLSGGNQQKVVLAKWLVRDCDVLIFDEPTRGIDVGAKSEIYALINELAKQGKAIIMISSDMPELLRMSDRILVMCEGRVSGIVPIEEATQERLMTLATA